MQKDFTKVFRPDVHSQFSYCNFYPGHCITGKQTNFFSAASNNGPVFGYIWCPDLKKDIVFSLHLKFLRYDVQHVMRLSYCSAGLPYWLF